jgi:hypothetical protein
MNALLSRHPGNSGMKSPGEASSTFNCSCSFEPGNRPKNVPGVEPDAEIHVDRRSLSCSRRPRRSLHRARRRDEPLRRRRTRGLQRLRKLHQQRTDALRRGRTRELQVRRCGNRDSLSSRRASPAGCRVRSAGASARFLRGPNLRMTSQSNDSADDGDAHDEQGRHGDVRRRLPDCAVRQTREA